MIAISDEWNQLQSAFETLLEQNFAITEDDKSQKRNINSRRFDAFRRLLLKNVSEEDEAAFEKEFNPPRAKKKRKRGEGMEAAIPRRGKTRRWRKTERKKATRTRR